MDIRTGFMFVDAEISDDGEQWFKVQVSDISAGGLLIRTERTYEKDVEIWIRLYINPILIKRMAENVSITSKALLISNRGTYNDITSYGAKFKDLSRHDKIRLHELISITVAKYGIADGDDDIWYR